MKKSFSHIAHIGILASLALVLSYVEHLVPLPVPVLGIKLGLSNTVLLYALFMLSKKDSVLLMFLKVLIQGFVFASFSAMLYSFAGGILSILAMILAKRLNGISVVGVSISGAFMHILGQSIVALFFITYKAVLSYLPFLLISSCVTGAITGIIAKAVLHHLSMEEQ